MCGVPSSITHPTTDEEERNPDWKGVDAIRLLKGTYFPRAAIGGNAVYQEGRMIKTIPLAGGESRALFDSVELSDEVYVSSTGVSFTVHRTDGPFGAGLGRVHTDATGVFQLSGSLVGTPSLPDRRGNDLVWTGFFDTADFDRMLGTVTIPLVMNPPVAVTSLDRIDSNPECILKTFRIGTSATGAVGCEADGRYLRLVSESGSVARLSESISAAGAVGDRAYAVVRGATADASRLVIVDLNGRIEREVATGVRSAKSSGGRLYYATKTDVFVTSPFAQPIGLPRSIVSLAPEESASVIQIQGDGVALQIRDSRTPGTVRLRFTSGDATATFGEFEGNNYTTSYAVSDPLTIDGEYLLGFQPDGVLVAIDRRGRKQSVSNSAIYSFAIGGSRVYLEELTDVRDPEAPIELNGQFLKDVYVVDLATQEKTLLAWHVQPNWVRDADGLLFAGNGPRGAGLYFTPLP